MSRLVITSLVLCGCSLPALSQQDGHNTAQRYPAPIYRVTVERRTIRAINYGHRSGPTKIDFRGTVLLPGAKGEAKVESRAGAVEIEAKFEKLEPPTRFGAEYLTYVLWAITPDGRPQNLGEVVTNASDKAHLKVTTQLQAFGIIVTAEPYFAVTQPSNVVVLENIARADTAGKVEEVQARYELLERGDGAVAAKTVEIQPPAVEAGRKLSQDQYEAVLALYQAQNALQIARAQGADRNAANTLRKAEDLYQQAQAWQAEKPGSKRVVTAAREAAQTAEDARTIAMKRKQRE